MAMTKNTGTNKILDIGIPCFNKGEYLKKCLESVNKHFVNNYSDIKVWIIDDDSPYKDEYDSIISNFNNFKIELIHMEENSGPGHCRNKVIELGEAPWITFVDDDEIFINNPIEELDDSYDIIRSDVYSDNGKLLSHKISNYTCALGVVFEREFLNKHNICFPKHINWVGTEDSAIILLTSVITKNIKYIEPFI